MSTTVKRRTILRSWIAGALAALPPDHASANTTIADIQNNWRKLLAPTASVADDSELLTLTDRQWRLALDPEQYRVLRHEETERSASSGLLFEDRPGIYVCAGCDLPLFSSEMKYDSGTGWPSFFTSIPGSLIRRRDVYLLYTSIEYHCARCGGHQGHIFDDGPEPTNERWCNNGVALRFIAAASD